MKTLYSIRDALGRELWWSSSRKQAHELAAQLVTPGDFITPSGKVGHAGYQGATNVLALHLLPVSVWKCTRQEPKETTK